MSSKNSIAALDGLRGILACLVLISHMDGIFLAPWRTEPFTVSAQIAGWGAILAVLCFFGLSGFVIALSVNANIRRNGGFSTLQFGLSRFWRVFPPLIIVIALTAALSLLLRSIDAETVPTNIAAARHTYVPELGSQAACLISACFRGYLSGGVNGPLWSLAYEIQLYFIVALVGFATVSTRGPVLRLAALLVVGGCTMYLLRGELTVGLTMLKVCYVIFAAGFCVSVARDHIRRLPVWISPVLLACGLPFLTRYFRGEVPFEKYGEDPSMLLAQVIFGVAFCTAIPHLNASWLARVKRIGSYSYSIYIFHFPIMLFIFFLIFRFSPEYLQNYRWLFGLGSLLIVISVLGVVGPAMEHQRSLKAFTMRCWGAMAARCRRESCRRKRAEAGDDVI